MASWDWTCVWHRSRENWRWPQLPMPREAAGPGPDDFLFQNYRITLNRDLLSRGPLYLENLFDHLIVHYIFCPRSLETAGLLSLAACRGLKDHVRAREMVNIFSDIVVDSFRLERSSEDEEKVLMGWKALAREELMPIDRIVMGFLGEYWDAALPRCQRPEVDLLVQIFSLGIRDKSLWPRQCQEMARVLEPFMPGLLGRGAIRSVDALNGSAHGTPLTFASELQPGEYQKALFALGLHGDLKRWYRDQSYSIEIRLAASSRTEPYPSGPVRWRLCDPCSELDVAYSLSMSPWLVPGVTTYKRARETGRMSPGPKSVPDLLVVLDSSRSMEGHSLGTKTHKATIAAFKACQFAYARGAEIAAINFSEKYITAPWTRDLNAVENVLVEYFCTRTHIPGAAVLELATMRPGCLILCITDTHIQNLYQEWEDLKKASEIGQFVLFCIDQAYRDRHVEDSLSSLGKVYYINRLQDLVSLVVDAAKKAYAGESFISLK
ncbi:MAG: VWA domain-containing protein [Methanothrix sp.]|nr:VWA domain-containing protein [Methanothrix sp.]